MRLVESVSGSNNLHVANKVLISFDNLTDSLLNLSNFLLNTLDTAHSIKNKKRNTLFVFIYF